MATTLNKVTVGNDFVLKIKVGLVQYGNNTVSWDYMDLTTCRNIVFNISCTKHNIDINLPFTIDSEDHSVISAIVRAELLHANSIYNFTISGLDSNGYRWTYISPKQQSFLTTAVTEETSAAAYTELAFTAGMIMPLAAQGKDGHTPYIGENNNWWINGVDTGISAISNIDVLDNYSTTAEIETMLDSYYTKTETDDLLDNVDLTGYATETYVDNAINNIDFPDADGNTVNYIKSNIGDYDGSGYYLDKYGNRVNEVQDYSEHFILDTGVKLTNDIEIEITCSNCIELPGIWYNWSYNVLMVYDPDTDKKVIAMCPEGGNNDLHMQVCYNNYSYNFTFYPDYNRNVDSIHTYKISLNTASIDGHNKFSYEGQDQSTITGVDWEDWMQNEGLSDLTIKCLPSPDRWYIYGLKIWKAGTLIRDYVPVTTDNGDGFHENVSNTDIISPEMRFEKRYVDTYSRNYITGLRSSINQETQGFVDTRIWQQAPVDCTNVINRILSEDTPTRWDEVIDLWEVSHNQDYHKHGRGRYYDCDIDTYLDKDENTQHNIATYRFWHPIQEKYYTITISYDYNDERGNLLSCTYEVSDYATKTYVDNAIANIPGGSTPDLSNYVTNSSLQTTLADYVTDTDLSTELNDYVTNSSLSTELNDYVTNSSLSTELSDYVTSSDLQNNILSDYVTGTSLSTTLADYATQNYVDSAIANIPGGSTPDLSNYVTNSSLSTTLADYVTATDLDNSINNDVYPAIDESPLYDSEYHWIPQGYNRFIGGSDTIKIYDRYLCDAAGQSMRSTNNSFKLGIIKTQTIDQYTAHTSITYDNEVSINIWYESIATRAITNNYEYFDTTFTLTTEDRDISFEVVNEGTDLSGHYVICKITGATFGAVTGYSDITVYNGELDTTDKTIVAYNVASLTYDVTKTRYTVLYNIQQNDFSTQNWTTDAILRGYGLIGNSGGTTINTVTQSQYDQLIADGLVESDQLYIIL